MLILGAQSASAFYDASIGRWLSRDPIEEEGGVNLHMVNGNDCINLIDPLGLAFESSSPFARHSVTAVPVAGYEKDKGLTVAAYTDILIHVDGKKLELRGKLIGDIYYTSADNLTHETEHERAYRTYYDEFKNSANPTEGTYSSAECAEIAASAVRALKKYALGKSNEHSASFDLRSYALAYNTQRRQPWVDQLNQGKREVIEAKNDLNRLEQEWKETGCCKRAP